MTTYNKAINKNKIKKNSLKGKKSLKSKIAEKDKDNEEKKEEKEKEKDKEKEKEKVEEEDKEKEEEKDKEKAKEKEEEKANDNNEMININPISLSDVIINYINTEKKQKKTINKNLLDIENLTLKKDDSFLNNLKELFPEKEENNNNIIEYNK